MEVQVRFINVDRLYSYDCINGGKIGDRVVILEGKLVGRNGSIATIGRGDYDGHLFQCWRPEFDETLANEWHEEYVNKQRERMSKSSQYGRFANADTA